MNSKAKQRAASTGTGRALAAPVSEDPRPAPARGAAMAPDPPAGTMSWTAEGGAQRLDHALAARCLAIPGLSRTRLQALVAEGCVAVDGRVVRTASARVAAGSLLSVDVPAPTPAEPRAQAIPLAVIFEDDHLLVIDKPAGLVVHPAPGHEDGTLVNALIAHCGDSLSGIGGVRRPGIVHRLDKDTSGLLVVAKTDAAHAGLTALFADHGRTGSLRRRYAAFVWGTPAAGSGVIDRPLGRHPHQREKMSIVAEGRGRHAVTRWDLAGSYGVVSLLHCELETGRTHQIRVHLTAMGHPLLGDPVYGTGYRTKAARLDPGASALVEALGRQALHAATLGFEHPVTGVPLHFASALPPDLQRLQDHLATAGETSP